MSQFPFGQVPVEDEHRYYDTLVTLKPATRLEPPRETSVVKVLNGGNYLEVRDPRLANDPTATIRVMGTQVQSVDVVRDARAH